MTTMGQLVYQSIAGDEAVQEQLTADGGTLRFYSRGSLGRDGVPSSPDLPYAMWGAGETQGVRSVRDTAPNTGVTSYSIYVYDHPGSFERIKAIHSEIRRVMLALAGTSPEPGMMVTDVVWLSSGSDQYDQVSKNNVKTETFQVVGKV